MNATYPSPIPGICTDSEWTTKIITQSEIVRGWVAAYVAAVRSRRAAAAFGRAMSEIEAFHAPVPVEEADPGNDGWDHDDDEVPCYVCGGSGVGFIAPDVDIDPCSYCAGFGLVFPPYDEQTLALAARKREREMFGVQACIEASEAAVAFGGYPEDLVTKVYACVGIEVPDWQGNPEVLVGCEACHFTGWTFHNGEPLDHCHKCKAGQALVAWGDMMDAADRKDCHY